MDTGARLEVDRAKESIRDILAVLRNGAGEVELHISENESGYWFRYHNGVLEKVYEGYGARPYGKAPASEEELRELVDSHPAHYVEVRNSIFDDTIR